MRSAAFRKLLRHVSTICALTCLAMGTLALEDGAAKAESGFTPCRKSVVHQYAPIGKALPPIRRLPASGRPSFAPSDVEISLIGLSPVVVGSGQVGFYSSAAAPFSRNLPLLVTVRLLSVSRSGQDAKVRATRQFRLEDWSELAKRNLGFRVGRHPRLYRVDVTFRRSQFESRFSEYFKVVRPRLGVRLGVFASNLAAGNTMVLRMENLGTTPIYYGYFFSVDQFVEGQWTPSQFVPDGWPTVGLGLLAGRSGPCEKYPLPADMPLGTYRIIKAYSLRLGQRDSRQVMSIFHVS